MRKEVGNRIFILVIVATLLFAGTMGCSTIFKRPQKEKNKETETQKKEPPKSLISLEKNTEKIIQEVQKVKEKKLDMMRQQQDKSQEEQQGKSQEKKQEGQSSKKQQGQQDDQKGKQEEKKVPETPKVNWPSLEKTVESLHSQWNTYEVQAQKDGASPDLGKGYELQLDTLTNWIMSHNEDETLKAANDLYQYYPKFLNLYKHQAPPDIKEIVYHVRQIIINGQADHWDDSGKRLDAIKEAWQTAKGRIDKPDQNLNQKIEASIEDFSRAVEEKNFFLAKFKADILLKNLQEIK